MNTFENIKVLLGSNIVCLLFWLVCAKIKGNKESTDFHLWTHCGRHKSVINKSIIFSWVYIFVAARNHWIIIKNKHVHKKGDKIQNFSFGNLFSIVHLVDLHAWNHPGWSSGRAFPQLQHKNKSFLGSEARKWSLTSPVLQWQPPVFTLHCNHVQQTEEVDVTYQFMAINNRTGVPGQIH